MTAIDLARRFEGCRLTAYKDIAGVWTIGYGHTGKDVTPTTRWTQEEAEQHLELDVAEAQHLLQLYSPGPFVTGALDALTDFVFNLGIGNYRGSSLRRAVDTQNWPEVKIDLLAWDHSGGQVIPGLLARRQAEADLIQVT